MYTGHIAIAPLARSIPEIPPNGLGTRVAPSFEQRVENLFAGVFWKRHLGVSLFGDPPFGAC